MRPVLVLKIAYPVGHAEVAEVHDGRNAQFFQAGKGFVGKVPVVLAGSGVGGVVLRAVAQVRNAQLLY